MQPDNRREPNDWVTIRRRGKGTFRVEWPSGDIYSGLSWGAAISEATRGMDYLGDEARGADVPDEAVACCNGGTVADCRARGDIRTCSQWYGSDRAPAPVSEQPEGERAKRISAWLRSTEEAWVKGTDYAVDFDLLGREMARSDCPPAAQPGTGPTKRCWLCGPRGCEMGSEVRCIVAPSPASVAAAREAVGHREEREATCIAHAAANPEGDCVFCDLDEARAAVEVARGERDLWRSVAQNRAQDLYRAEDGVRRLRGALSEAVEELGECGLSVDHERMLRLSAMVDEAPGEEGPSIATDEDVALVYRRMLAALEGVRAERSIMRAAVELIAAGGKCAELVAQRALAADSKRREDNLAAMTKGNADGDA